MKLETGQMTEFWAYRLMVNAQAIIFSEKMTLHPLRSFIL